MKITPQDIIDKEFRVKFRGFDMAEVDAFLEEVAENFFKLTEENTQLHEKVLALQRDLETGGSFAPQGQLELPPELGTLLEDLKQDTAAISAELSGLKHDKGFDSLEKNIKEAVASIAEMGGKMVAGGQLEIPADLDKTLEEFKQNSAAIGAELEGLKEYRQAFATLKNTFEEVIAEAKEAASSVTPQQVSAGVPDDLSKNLETLNSNTESFTSELAELKKELSLIAKVREEIKEELHDMLSARFAELEAKLSAVSYGEVEAPPKPKAAPKAAPKKEKLAVAEIVEEPEELEEDTRLPDYEEDDQEDDSDLEFLTEDDLLDVDKLRGIFQSALDEGIGDGPVSRDGGDETTADLLFLEDDFMEDDHEPEVILSLDDHETEEQPKLRKS